MHRSKKFKGKTFSELLSFSIITTDRYINRKLQRKKKLSNLEALIYYEKDESLQDYIENHLIYDPIPKEVEQNLSTVNKEILCYIFRKKSISVEGYSEAFDLKLDTADKRIRRFRETIKKEMLKWKQSHPEEANLMPEIFYCCESH